MSTSARHSSRGRRAGFLASVLSGTVALSLAVSPSASANPVADQSHGGTASSILAVQDNQWMGQTFTPSVTDVLSQVLIPIFVGYGSGSVTMRVFDTASGLPTGPALASQGITGIPSASIASSSCATVAPTLVTFSTPAALVAGHQYAFTIETTAPSFGAYVCGNSTPAYAGGATLISSPLPTWALLFSGGDLLFTTYMGPFDPEPFLIERQSLPMPSSGDCSAIDDAAYAYGTGLHGGWQKAWEFWVKSPTPGVAGGWACSRALINTGGQIWRVDNSGL